VEKKFYVTTAIAYPNSKPHLGHALEIIHADVIARFNKLLGNDVWFQTGTDEHGLKNWQSALEEKKDIIEFLDGNVSVFRDLYKKLNIQYDNFIRTSDKKVHYPRATKLWKALVESGDIYKKKYKGLYCTGCESFKTEKELEDWRCSNHPTRTIEIVEEENYFFKLSKYKNKIVKKISSDDYKIVPKVRKKEILSILKEIEDISFSRPKTTLPWGIPVPGDDDHVMYVWCDALSNYLTGAGYSSDDKKFANLWPADVQVIGKDILKFHAAYWPAMLLSAGLELPKELFVHGFVLSAGAKMGKSTGNVIEPFNQIEKYGVDQFRFYLAGAVPINGDGDYTSNLVEERINAELVGNLSNFCYRVMSFLNNNYNSTVGNVKSNSFIDELENEFEAVKLCYRSFDFKKVIDRTLAISALGNKYFQEKEPWKLIKKDSEKAHSVVSLCIHLVKNLSIAFQPIIPGFSEALQKQLNVKNLSWEDINFKQNKWKIGTAEIIFRPVEESLSKIFPLDLRVGKILSAKDHPNADKLYVLEVDVGEKRQLVAGIKKAYEAKVLIGKYIIVCVNLEPAELRGVESQGMLLAADDGINTEILEASKSKPGDAVMMEGYANSTESVSHKAFSKLRLKVQNGKIVWKGTHLHTATQDIKVGNVQDGANIR
jgi:methionyl-tRNA synthetase